MMGDLKRDYIWNTLGSAIYAFFSMVLVFAAMGAAGPDDGGIFSFGFSTLGQQMFIVAYFGIRPFHITDTAREYSYRDYRALRLLTAGAAVAMAVIYLAGMTVSGHYSARKSAIIILLVMYKICDGIADLYESECQRTGKLYIGGMELAARSLLCGGSLLVLLLITGSVVISAAAANVLQLISILYFGRYTERVLLGAAEPEAAEAAAAFKSRHAELFRSTWVIFLAVFLDFYIFSASRYAIDFNMDDSASGIFNVIFLPASVIYITANFIIRPCLNRLSVMWEQGERAGFKDLVLRLLRIIAVMSAAGLLLTAAAGGPALGILEIIMGTDYKGLFTARFVELVLIILGGCFYAAANLFYYVLIIMRRQMLIFAEYLAMSAVIFVIVNTLVRAYGITGAAAAYAVYMGILASVLAVSAFMGIREGKGLENKFC